MTVARSAARLIGGARQTVSKCRSNLPVHSLRHQSGTTTRQWSTPLAKSLAEAITTTGPISLANYMRQCLTSPEGGYYTTRTTEGTDQFGKTGDFITSPEISQIFGELVGIWFVAEWMQQGRVREGVQLVELGPGRGTLMDDVLRTIANFKVMAGAIDTVFLVEASPILREAQRKLLCGDEPMQEHSMGQQSVCKRIPNAKVVWVEDIKFIPREATNTPFIIAHEFFDALPIHAFQSIAAPLPQRQTLTLSTTPSPAPTRPQTRPEWRELLVSPTAPPSILNPPKTPPPEFELTLAKAHTHHSRLLPALSPRYDALLSGPIGATIEISPETQTTVTYLTELISGTSQPVLPPLTSSSRTTTTARTPPAPRLPAPPSKPSPSGAALLIDYGPTSTIPINSLRGIRSHVLTSPFASPGQTDLSADVDFGAIVEVALGASEKVEVHGPVGQGDWLESMGGRERLEALVRRAEGGGGKAAGAGQTGEADGDKEGKEEVIKRLRQGWDRLTGRGNDGMGRLYKVLAVVPERGGKRPVGFGGDV